MSDQLYREACQRERLEDCAQLAKRLGAHEFGSLTVYERGVLEALLWATGESDEPPVPIGGDDE